MRCAIITSRSFLSTPLPDDLLLKMALEARGVEVRLQAWEERPPTEASDVAIIRSAWNAHLFPDTYLRWAKKTAEKSLILNPFKVVQWNMHKALYFRDLAFLGIPLIPTIVLRPEKHRLAKLMQQLSWPEIILKPRCGANSYAVQKITQENLVQGQACLDQSREDFLMQPYLASIHSSGENCHCFLGGRWSHGFSKTPFTGRSANTSFPRGEHLVVPPLQEITLANQIFTIAQKLLGTPFTYGRVDLVRNKQDELCLMELELHEPVLHLEIEQAATVLAENIITQADKVTHKRYALA